MRLVQFGGYPIPQYDLESSLPVSARSALLDLPNGAFDQDGGSLYLEANRLKARFVVADADVDATMDSLMKYFGKGRRLLKAVMRNGWEYRQTWAKIVNVQRERRNGMMAYQPMVAEFERDYPYWLASADEPIYLDQGYKFDGTWNFTAGHVETRVITASPHNFTISNTGGIKVPRGYILIVPRTASNFANLTVSNGANAMSFNYTGSLAALDSLEIDFLTKSIRKNGADVYSSGFTPAGQLDWMILELGSNAISVTGTVTGTVDFWWQWSRHYL